MKLTAVLTPAPEGGFVAFDPETGTSSQGESETDEVANLREAKEVYLEEFPRALKGSPITKTFEVLVDA
jgi:predicted RNase H-like HicB family nuclease